MEEFKIIKDFPDYQISNQGKVKSLKRKKEIILKPAQYSNGYWFVTLTNSQKTKSCLIHRLVLMTFNPVENMENLQVNHIDGNINNNFLKNLEWTTPKENKNHREKINHTPKSETILVKFLTGEEMIFPTMTKCAEYFGVSRKAIQHYCESKTIRKDRKIQAEFIRLGRTYSKKNKNISQN